MSGCASSGPADLEGAMQEAFACKDRFVFLDVVVDPTENVYPMIAAGKGHHEMHLSAGAGAGLTWSSTMSSDAHIISVLLENEAGALSRVAGLFSARGYNIESLTVAPTDDPSLSRMTLVTTGNDEIVEQIKKQLNKLIDVVKLLDLSEGPHIEREMMLIKVRAERRDREELKRLADIFRAKIIDVTDYELCRRADRRLQEARRLHPRRPRGPDRRGGPLRPHRHRPRRKGPDPLTRSGLPHADAGDRWCIRRPFLRT